MELRPFRSIRFSPRVIRERGLSNVFAPPYDQISPERQDQLYGRAPENIVRVTYPKKEGPDPYAEAAKTLADWLAGGILEKEKRPLAAAFALLLRAGIALRRGRPEHAAEIYNAAEAAFIGLSMMLYAAAARRRWGEIQGGVAGMAAVRDANDWMLAQRIRNPERMTALMAPL